MRWISSKMAALPYILVYNILLSQANIYVDEINIKVELFFRINRF